MPPHPLPMRPPPVGPLPAPVPRALGDTSPPAACRKVFEELCVLANGDIVCSSCDVNGRWVYGNVFTDRIMDVFNGPRYREMREWQLRSRPDSWCPAIDQHCPMRTPLPTPPEPGPLGVYRVKVLKIEPVTRCNLYCPVCPVVTHFVHDPAVRDRRADRTLPLEVMVDVVEQLPDIQTLLYYNFGEPLLHKGTVEFLRAVRRLRPACRLATNTNGLPLSAAAIRAIATEALLDTAVFSIDGATQESYQRYRVGGNWAKAVEKMAALVRACREAGTAERVRIVWQYILFEWNDGDAELARAKELAAEIGVPIDWVVTSGPEASKRFLSGSEAIARLTSGTNSWWYPAAPTPLVTSFERERGDGAVRVYTSVPMTCEVTQTAEGGEPRARFRCDEPGLTAPLGAVVMLSVRMVNRSGCRWDPTHPNRLRLGLLLGPGPHGRPIEVGGAIPPAQVEAAGGEGVARIVTTLPDRPGDYQLIVDALHEGQCWFHERGSEPLVYPVRVA